LVFVQQEAICRREVSTDEGCSSQMIKRANYVAFVWKECGSSYPDLPAPTSHGWSQDGERLQAIPTTLAPAPKAVLELVKCGCRGSLPL